MSVPNFSWFWGLQNREITHAMKQRLMKFTRLHSKNLFVNTNCSSPLTRYVHTKSGHALRSQASSFFSTVPWQAHVLDVPAQSECPCLCVRKTTNGARKWPERSKKDVRSAVFFATAEPATKNCFHGQQILISARRTDNFERNRENTGKSNCTDVCIEKEATNTGCCVQLVM